MKNKKVIVVIVAIIISMILCSCTSHYDSDNKDNIDSSITSGPQRVVGQASSSLTFDDAILESYLIIKGTLIASKDNIVQDSNGNKAIVGDICEFNNLEVIKGDYNKETIKVRITNSLLGENYDLYKKGEEYYLFLSRTNLVYDGEERFHLYGYSICINGKGNLNIYRFNSLVESDIQDSIGLKSYIDNVLEKNNKSETEVFNLDSGYCTSEIVSDIVDSSEIILVVETKKIDSENENIVCITCEVCNVYKGDVEKEISIIFFKDNYEINKKYLVLLSDFSTPNYFLSSQNSCILISDTETYQEYMKYINK